MADNFGLKIGVEGEREFKRLSPILISPLRYCVTANLSCPAIDGVCCPDAARVIAPKKKGAVVDMLLASPPLTRFFG